MSSLASLSNIPVKPSAEPPRKIQRELWIELHELIKRRFERTLFTYIENLISNNFPSYCSSDGKVIDRRLAKRIGVDPALICRLRSEDSGALNRLAHFLSLMNLCGVEWEEVGFPSPQVAVVDAIVELFPSAERMLGFEVHENPTREEVLLLNFVTNSKSWQVAYENRGHDSEKYEIECEKIFILVACADSDSNQNEGPLVENQLITSGDGLLNLLSARGQTWDALYETFPFLGLPLDRKGTAGWGIF